MLVLSQMMRASDVSLRAALWASVNTPGFSHHSLEGGENRQRLKVMKATAPEEEAPLVQYRSPWRILWNWVEIRQANRGPTLPPGTKGSATPPSHTSMLSGVPYRSRSLRARDVLFSTAASCALLRG